MSFTIYSVVIAVCVLFSYLILFSLKMIGASKCTENYEVKNGVFGCLRVARKFDILKDSITYVTKV